MKNLLIVSQGFTIFGLTVSWYGLIIALAMILGVFVVAFGYVFWFSRKVQADIDAGKV